MVAVGNCSKMTAIFDNLKASKELQALRSTLETLLLQGEKRIESQQWGLKRVMGSCSKTGMNSTAVQEAC